MHMAGFVTCRAPPLRTPRDGLQVALLLSSFSILYDAWNARGAPKLKTFVFDRSASSCPVSRGSRRALVVSFTLSDLGLADTYT